MIQIERDANIDPWITPAWMIRETVGRAEVTPMKGLEGAISCEELEDRCETTEDISSLMDDLCRS